MADRKRSKDGKRDTDEILGPDGAVDQAGRSGGTLERDIASRDEQKRSVERPAGATRVRKSDETGNDDA